MIELDRVGVFLNALETDLPSYLEEIEEYGRRHGFPLIKRETASLLIFMINAIKAGKILEIGTAIGYSALLIAYFGKNTARIDTIEINEKNADLAEENFRKHAGLSGSEIDLIRGDAGIVLPALEGPYDFIFLDSAKGQYPLYLPELKRLLAPGGVLFTDNILQEGTLLESRYFVERRDRTIHSRIREFLYQIKHDDELISAVIPVGDGVALSYKKEKNCGEKKT